MISPHALAARVAVSGLAGITPPAHLTGYVLIAVADTDEEPRVVSDLPPGHVLMVVTGIAAGLAVDALETEVQP